MGTMPGGLQGCCACRQCGASLKVGPDTALQSTSQLAVVQHWEFFAQDCSECSGLL
jgi:hypothetical protein